MSIRFDERWAQGRLLLWINEVIKSRKIPFSKADQEVQIKTRKGLVRYPDIVIWDGDGRIACLIELKKPVTDVYDDSLVEDALRKASLAGIPFFVTWNINKLVLWETFKEGTSLLDRRLLHQDVLDIKDLRALTRTDVERRIKVFLAEFLKTLYVYYEQKVPRPERFVLPKLNPDEIMIYRLKTVVDALYIPLSNFVMKKKQEDPEFYGDVAEWFVSQGWIFGDTEEDYDRLSRQAIYLLINKILFYNVLRSRFGLKPIEVAAVKSGEELKQKLQEFFNIGIKFGYGVIFAADFLEKIPIPDELVKEIKKLVVELNKYDFSKIGYDIIGRIFEKLIPKTERHKLGQYFTRSDVVDLILGFTVKHPDNTVLDPACGSGTFLVRAYYRKKYLAEKFAREGKYPKFGKSHDELIREIWGVDIAKFPAHLSVINLVVRDLKALENVPKIACRDFFDINPGLKSLLYELVYEVPGIAKEDIEVEFPKSFDVVVTNPPYTRQEEMEDVFLGGYKDRLRELVKRIDGIQVGKRSSIYAYFFFHGAHFLESGGRLGLITSNSWLDVDFGKFLQEYFLDNFKIIAIIESKVERWFEDADINTAITILEKCNDEKERDSNLVKFVYLKKPLKEFIPPVEDEEERWSAVEKLVEFIENCGKEQAKEIDFLDKKLWIFEDDRLRITMISQADLYAEGYNEETNRFEGSKWGKYIRAPEIFFKILEKGRDLFVPLRKIAQVRRGFTTGANEFFYLTPEQIEEHKIEREFWMHPVTREEWPKIKEYIPKEDIWLDKNGKYFKKSQYADQYELEEVIIDGNVIWVPNYIVKSPRECKSIIVDPRDLKYRVLMIHKDKRDLAGTNVLKYIEWGEEQRFHERPTCASRQRWYDLPEIRGELLCMMSLNDRHIFWSNNVNSYIDARLYGISLKERYKGEIELVSAILNSSFIPMFVELWGRVNLGQGALDVKVYEYEKMPVINPNSILDALSDTEIKKIKN
ncbi:MAG TPA: restriction endonuclease subunit M, partial [Thermococcus sp.]|nr:restriction endonuclease subunit M [Thermococcus sp.]